MEKKHNRIGQVIVVLAIIGAFVLAGCRNRSCYSHRIRIHTGAGGFATQSVIRGYANEYAWDGFVLTYTNRDGREVTVMTEGHLVTIEEGRFCPLD